MNVPLYEYYSIMFAGVFWCLNIRCRLESLVNTLTRNSKRGGVNVGEYTDMTSETDLESEFAKVIPISTVKRRSGQAGKYSYC